MFDKFHDECGVFAIYGHPEAANLAYHARGVRPMGQVFDALLGAQSHSLVRACEPACGPWRYVQYLLQRGGCRRDIDFLAPCKF